MGNLKNYIIKKLGGYTAEEYKSATSIRAPKIHEITHLDLVDVKAEMKISRFDLTHIEPEISERILRTNLMQKLMDEVEPLVQLTLWEPEPGESIYTAEAALRVLRPRREE